MSSTDAVNTISESLKEADELPRKQIADIIEVLGESVALELLAEVARVQAEGGLDVRDGTRRRTDGGVFFNLAKARLPKTDRNRIFRIRPPKAPTVDAAQGAPAAGEATEAAAGVGSSSREVARRPVGSGASGGVPVVARDSGAQGRRRVVEIEVVRHHVKPSSPTAPAGAPPPPTPRPTEERPAAPQVRPVRRIIVAAPPPDAPPATPEAARERIRGILRGFPPAAQKAVLGELLRELGAEPSPPEQGKKATPGAGEGAPLNREQVLASVTEALGLTSGDLARALYSDDGPGSRAKARAALERWRRSQG